MGKEKIVKMVASKKDAEKENKIKEFLDKTGQVAAMIGPDVIGDAQALDEFQKYSVFLTYRQNTGMKLFSKRSIIEKMIDKSSTKVTVDNFTAEEREAMDNGIGKFLKRKCNFSYCTKMDWVDLVRSLRIDDEETDEDLGEQAKMLTEIINTISEMLTTRVGLMDVGFDAECFTFATISKPETITDEVFNKKIEELLLEKINTYLSTEEIRTAYKIGFGIPIK